MLPPFSNQVKRILESQNIKALRIFSQKSDGDYVFIKKHSEKIFEIIKAACRPFFEKVLFKLKCCQK